MNQLFPFSNEFAKSFQTELDGGLISFIIQNYVQNKSTDNAQHFSEVIVTGKFLAALVIFSVVAFLLFIYLLYFILKFALKQGSPIYERIQFWSHQHKLCKDFEKVIFVFVTLMIMILGILGLIATDGYKEIMIARSNDQSNDSYSKQTTFMGELTKSIDITKSYLQTLPDTTNETLLEVIPKVLKQIEIMQEKNSKLLSNKLNEDMGVTQVLNDAQFLLDYIFTLFTNVTSLSNHEKQFFSTVNKIEEQLDEILIELTLLKRTEIKNCDEGSACSDRYMLLRDELRKTIDAPNILKKALDFVSSFEFIMKQQNMTLDSIKANIEKGNKEAEMASERVKKKMEKEMNFNELFKNLSDQGLQKLNDYLEYPIELLKNQSIVLQSDGPEMLEKYVSPFIIISFLVFILTFLFLALSFCYKYWLYNAKFDSTSICFPLFCIQNIFVIFALAFTLITLQMGAYVETSVCRYTDPQQRVFNSTSRSLYLDSDINMVIDQVLEDRLTSFNISLQTPLLKNVLYAVLIRCRNNSGILEAVDFNLDAFPQNLDQTAGFMEVGKTILLEEIRALNATKMMPDDVLDSLVQAQDLEMFSTFNYKEKYSLVNSSSVKSWINTMEANVTSFLHWVNITDSQQKKVNRHLNSMNYYTINSEDYLTKIKNDMKHIESLPSIKPVIQNLLKNIRVMLSSLKNKTSLIVKASQLYEDLIVKGSKNFSQQLTSNLTSELKSSLGRCRLLYNAFVSGNEAVCGTAGRPINSIWFILICMLILFIPLTIRVMSFFLQRVYEKRIESSYEVRDRRKSSGMYRNNSLEWIEAKEKMIS